MADKNIRIGFRADANEFIASGHIMRCMAIALQCKKLGAQCIFILAEDKQTDRLIKNGFAIKVLNSNWKNLDEEIDKIKVLISDEELDFLVVDSYQASADYMKILNELVPVLYIDDVAAAIYDITAVLHYGSGSDYARYISAYLEMHNTDVLAGSKYIPLREEFMQEASGNADNAAADNVYENAQREKCIMITTGATDPFDITRKLLDILVKDSSLDEYSFEVIVGAMNRYLDEIDSMAVEFNRIHVHRNVQNMSYYMRNCMAAVSAGGTTLFELCACGTPTVCFSFADNQKGGTTDLDNLGIMQYVGDAREINVVPLIERAVKNLLENDDIWNKYSRKMKMLVDGRGAARIAAYIISKAADSCS